ncbi:site-specific integrase [Aquisphaera insulae]|uniref:site-specific integrase n=1 Tax=Aquisphaera insulae TaxID=2712864 RepID=UPI0013EB81FF|nr:site-specific integrase [Aquisphaera insulae]
MAVSNPTRQPSYRLHRPSGQAVVTIDRKDRYLGKFGSPESRVRYERLISEWMAGKPAIPPADPGQGLTVAELGVAYLRHAEGYFLKDGKPTSELKNVKAALRGLRGLYAALPARELSPLKLKAVRDKWIEAGLARTNCNRHTRCVVRIYAWAVENELVAADVWQALKAVKALAEGRSVARETAPVVAVDDATTEATLVHMDATAAAMVRLQLLLACRPGEICTMRPSDIDRREAVWLYRPEHHKTEHRGKERVIPIGPRAQLLLAPILPAFAG